MRHVIVFRSRLREGIEAEYGNHAGKIYELAVAQPGFLSAKDFTAGDGERLALIEWASAPELHAWREHLEHRAAQDRGRSHYYATYSLQICSEIRASEFVTGGEPVRRGGAKGDDTRAIAEAWLAAFEARDLDALLALYTDDATHQSPKIRALHPETGGKIVGKAAMRAWWADSFARLSSLRYIQTAITADPDSVLLEYVRRVDGEPDMPIAEVFDVRSGRIVASRVFHG
jgi:heme-degrading monooxygenase HmoA/ketosteroid isomerase-like protein